MREMEDGAFELSVADLEGQPRRRSLLPWLLAALTTAGFATAVADDLNRRQRTRADLASAREESSDLRKQVFRAEDRAAQAAADRARAADLEQKLANTRDASDKLIDQLRAQLDAKDGEVSKEAGRVTVNLVDEILFPSGESALSPRGEAVLTKVGGVLKGLTDREILIGGHTDDRPIHTAVFPSNWELSSARAVTVVHFLAETAGVDPRRLAAAGYSQYHPRGRNRAKNRRIEILLTPIATVTPIATKK